MATRGRGRGRGSSVSSLSGRVAVDRKARLPQTIEELNGYLTSLNEGNFSTYGDEFVTMILGFSTNESRLKDAVTLIFDVVVESRDNVLFGAKVCHAIVDQSNLKDSQGDTASKKKLFLKMLLSRFQSEFSKKADTRCVSIEQWLSIFSFLCEVFHRIKISNNQPISVAGRAIIGCMEWLLSAEDYDDDEVECVCNYFKMFGQVLETIEKEKVKNVVGLLRKKVVSRLSSCKVRCVVMEVLEYRAMGWKDIDQELDRFYLDAITDAAVEDDLATIKGGQ